MVYVTDDRLYRMERQERRLWKAYQVAKASGLGADHPRVHDARLRWVAAVNECEMYQRALQVEVR